MLAGRALLSAAGAFSLKGEAALRGRRSDYDTHEIFPLQIRTPVQTLDEWRHRGEERPDGGGLGNVR